MKPAKLLILFIAALFLLTSCKLSDERIKITDLRCEYLENPLGIDTPFPRLSWRLKSSERGQKQTAYQIITSSEKNGGGDLWDTGKVLTDQSQHIKYGGKTLNSRQKVFWKVRVWDKDGKVTPWSEDAYFETAFLNPSDWKALWIGGDTVITDKEKSAPLFKKIVNIDKNIEQARIYISGLGYYELKINGQKVGNHVLSPNQTNYDRRLSKEGMDSRVDNMSTRILYETFDISNALKSGVNTINVLLGNGWYYSVYFKSLKRLWYDTPRFIAQIEITFKDGSKQIIVSDDSWKYCGSPLIYNDLYTGEIYDARLEDKTPQWKKVLLVRPPTGKLYTQMSPPDRIVRTIKPVSCKKMSGGVWRFDLGEMISGWAELKINGKRGDRIKMKFLEEMGPSYYQSDTYILKGNGEERFEPHFTWHGFRIVDVYGSSVPLTVENITGKVVNTDVHSNGYFECSNDLFNKIHENYRRTQLGNMHGGVPSDCPHRERRGYTGDGQIAAPPAIFNFDMAAFYTKWLNDIFDTQNAETGYIANTNPYQDGGGGLAWEAAGVIIPWYMYLYYGDRDILEHYYGNMKKWVEYTESHTGKDGIVREQQLGVWAAPEAAITPANLVSTAYYYYALALLQKIAAVLRQNDDKAYFEILAQQTKNAFNKKYYDKRRRSYSVGKQGANIFPLGFDMVPAAFKDGVLNTLLRHLEEDTQYHFDTGMMATPLLLQLLNGSGNENIAYTLMNQRDFPSFGLEIIKGATTLWETWQGDASHSHPMYGSVCRWFYEDLAGIRPDPEQPGFKRVIIKPHPVGGLDWVKAAYKSAYGVIKSQWRVENGNFMLDIVIPANSTALIYLPAADNSEIRESGKILNKSADVKLIRRESDRAVIEISSGKYSFISKNIGSLIKTPKLLAPDIRPLDSLIILPQIATTRIISYNKGAEIRYTLDGSKPGPQSALYQKPFEISKNTTIKARLFKKGYAPGPVKSSRLVFLDPQKHGLTYNYYEGAWKKLPDFAKLKIKKSGKVYKIGLQAANGRSDRFALLFKGFINIPVSGRYTFYINSNDGTRLLIDKKVAVLNDGEHGPVEKQGSLALNAGKHALRLEYFQAGGGLFLEAFISGPDMEKQSIPADWLTIE